MECLIRKTDDELQIVYGEVYAPNVPDTQGEFMEVVEVRKMAHRFMENMLLDKVDTNHNNELNGSVIVESFIARHDDTVFIPDAWVVGMHVPDVEMWKQIKSGEINGFSMEALVRLDERIVEIEVPENIQGLTSKSEEHEHRFHVRFDENGSFLGGTTSEADGHFHEIRKGSVTEKANGHSHRFSIAEQMNVITEEAA